MWHVTSQQHLRIYILITHLRQLPPFLRLLPPKCKKSFSIHYSSSSAEYDITWYHNLGRLPILTRALLHFCCTYVMTIHQCYRQTHGPHAHKVSTTCTYCMSYCNLLAVPRHRLNTYGGRAFTVAGPTVWNSLPDFIRDPSISTDSFRRLLKTYLFARY